MSPKVQLCLDELGMDFDEFIESSEAHDSVVIGACKNPGCEYTSYVEPDCREGWCEECQTQTVKSILVYMGVI